MPQTVKGWRSWQDNCEPQAQQAGYDKKPEGQRGNKAACEDGAVYEFHLEIRQATEHQQIEFANRQKGEE